MQNPLTRWEIIDSDREYGKLEYNMQSRIYRIVSIDKKGAQTIRLLTYRNRYDAVKIFKKQVKKFARRNKPADQLAQLEASQASHCSDPANEGSYMGTIAWERRDNGHYVSKASKWWKHGDWIITKLQCNEWLLECICPGNRVNLQVRTLQDAKIDADGIADSLIALLNRQEAEAQSKVVAPDPAPPAMQLDDRLSWEDRVNPEEAPTLVPVPVPVQTEPTIQENNMATDNKSADDVTLNDVRNNANKVVISTDRVLELNDFVLANKDEIVALKRGLEDTAKWISKKIGWTVPMTRLKSILEKRRIELQPQIGGAIKNKTVELHSRILLALLRDLGSALPKDLLDQLGTVEPLILLQIQKSPVTPVK